MCNKCKGAGLIPFIKNGKVISHAFIDCKCKEDEPEHYVPYSPDRIDFPVSWDWHRHYQQYYGQPDPGPLEESSIKPPEPIIEVQGGVPFEVHDNLKGLVLKLQRDLNKHTDASKKKGKMKPW